MPLGPIPWNRRLGIANSQTPLAADFGSKVLKLPAHFPISQQQLVHSAEWRDGPSAGAEWCGTEDAETKQECTFREISAHDTQFARRNLSHTAGMDFLTHRSTCTNQLYYVNNEPDSGSYLSTDPSCTAQSFEPRDREIDPYLSGVFTEPTTHFWELAPGGLWTRLAEKSTSLKRIRSDALAYVYLMLRRETEEDLGRGHIVLPPSSADALLGATNPNYANSGYWQDFFEKIHRTGVKIGNYREDRITPRQLKALHLHHYSNSPLDPRFMTMTPLESVAMSATYIRTGVNWYRSHYSVRVPLPVDILMTEIGPAYQYNKNPRQWAGGWTGFQTGLEWWNTWLCWLTRNAPLDCNLQGWDSGEHTVHACIHHPSAAPFTGEPGSLTQRNQWYFNSDTWSTDVFYGMPVKEIPQLEREIKFRAYEKSFSALEFISWEGRNWLRTPFGA